MMAVAERLRSSLDFACEVPDDRLSSAETFIGD